MRVKIFYVSVKTGVKVEVKKRKREWKGKKEEAWQSKIRWRK